MFDTYRVGCLPSSTTVNVEVKDSNAADAARLYGEVLEKARAEVLESFTVQNEVLNFTAVRLFSPATLSTKIGVILTLNGKILTKTIDIAAQIMLAQGRDSAFRMAADLIARELSRTVLEAALSGPQESLL